MTNVEEVVWQTVVGLFVLVIIVAIAFLAAQLGWGFLLVPVVLLIAWILGRLTTWALTR